MKKIDKDPFSNGEELDRFEYKNCNRCIKASQPREDGTYTNADKHNMPNKCSIQRDIIIRMFCNEPINERTIKVCYDFTLHGILCPYLKTERKKYPKRYKNQTTLEL